MQNNILNKEYHTAGSSGSAAAAPRMTEKCGCSIPSLSLRGGFANEAISCRLPRPIGLAMTGECGRSMVEMLGVLAVIGVLSVAGIAGYSNAMNKHRANELLNEASKRATVVAAQAMQGRETFSINEFPNNTALKFSETVEHDKTNGQFTLTITGVSEAVCQQMKNAMGPVIRKFTPTDCSTTTITLTYNDDMSATEKASDYDGNSSACGNAGKKYCTGSNTCVDTGTNCTCSETIAECKVCDTDTGSIVNATDGTECTGGTCQSGTCETASTCTLTSTDCPAGVDTTNCVCESTEGQTCTDHTANQCGLGYYCQFNPSSCSASGNGVCTAISGGTEVDGHWVGPSPSLDWWSANSWCIGKGSSGSITYATLQSAYDFDTMNSKGLTGYYWSAEDDDACYAFYVSLEFGFVSSSHDGNAYALCE